MERTDNVIQNSLWTKSEVDNSYVYKQVRKDWWPRQNKLLVGSFQIKQINKNVN